MKKITIIGATGFGGLGLIEIILRHPEFKIHQLVARKDTGKPVSEIFPHLKGFCDINVETIENVDYKNTDLVFFSTPDRAGMTIIKKFYNANIPVIDFSGDFRFNSSEDYTIYAKNKGMESNHLATEYLEESVYGLPELNFDKIKNSKIIGNPGCFSTAMILGLLPLAAKNLIKPGTIICDGKTGVSGAGKSSGEANLYPQRHENINTYREGHHQHTVEVENIIDSFSNDNKILFIPQVIPMNRGILITSYLDLNKNLDSSSLSSLYKNYYSDKPFISITDKSPNSANVKGSNRCEIMPYYDNRTDKVVIISVIDNLIKGQSGNAIQNANIMMNLDETTGLNHPAFYP